MDKLKIRTKEFTRNLKLNVPILILALIDVVTMAIPFYMENYIPNLYSSLHISASQYSVANAVYAFVSIPCYLFGSYISDRVKSKTLIIASLIIVSVLGVWYVTLPFNTNSDSIAIQLYIIFAGFSLAECGILWAPLWKVVKNHRTEELVGEEKEKRVGENNGLEGATNGLIGLTLALFGTLLLFLSNNRYIPTIKYHGDQINLGFFILVTIYVGLTILSLFLTMFFIKKADDNHERTFSLKSLGQVAKSWKLWALGILVLGVYMVQMGLSAYVNYLSNVFLISAFIVSLIGIGRTYIARFLISSWFGKKADKGHSNIWWICMGLILSIILIIIGIALPGFSNNFKDTSNKTLQTAMAVLAAINLLALGAVTWALVTIRWSPIGTELKIKNENYGAAVSLISLVAFSPEVFFRSIKSYLEGHYSMTIIDPATGHTTQVASQLGNQLILVIVLAFAVLGLIAGMSLYIALYKNKETYKFKRFKKQTLSIE